MSVYQRNSKGDWGRWRELGWTGYAYTSFDVALLVLVQVEPGVDSFDRGALEEGVLPVVVAHGCGLA